MDVVRVLAIGRVGMRAEQLALHDFREAQDRVQRRAQLVAHGGEEAGLGEARLLGSSPSLVGVQLRLLELDDQAVLLGLHGKGGERRVVEAAREEQEEALRADREGDERRRAAEPGVREDAARNRDRHEARVDGERDTGRQHGCRRRREQQREQHEGFDRGRVNVDDEGDDGGPGGSAQRLADREAALPAHEMGGGVAVGQEAIDPEERNADGAREHRGPGEHMDRGHPECGDAHDAEGDGHQRRRRRAMALGENPKQFDVEGALPAPGGGELLPNLAHPHRVLPPMRRRRGIALATTLNHLGGNIIHRRNTPVSTPHSATILRQEP